MEENALYVLASGEEESTRNYGLLLICGIMGAFGGYVFTEKIKWTLLGAIGGIGWGLIYDAVFGHIEPPPPV